MVFYYLREWMSSFKLLLNYKCKTAISSKKMDMFCSEAKKGQFPLYSRKLLLRGVCHMGRFLLNMIKSNRGKPATYIYRWAGMIPTANTLNMEDLVLTDLGEGSMARS